MEGSLYSFLEDNFVLVAVFIVLGCIVYGYRTLFSNGTHRDLLSARHVRLPPRTLVTDPNARNAVLKQRFKPEKVPANLDAIVIGSGIGGLTTAVLLGRTGQKVLVLERHDQAGGTCHTFIDKGYEFDTGIHYVGQMGEGDELRILLDQVTEGQVSWSPLDRDFDRIVVQEVGKIKRYNMMAGTRKEFLANLVRQFPREKEALTKWMELIEDTHKHYMRLIMLKMLPLPLLKFLVKTRLFHMIFGGFMRSVNRTVMDALDDLTDNLELKDVLTYFGYLDLGLRPNELILPGYEWMINHTSEGCFYPHGGPSEVPFQMIPIIEGYGGRVLVDASITRILVDSDGRANGVTVHKSSGDINIYAKRIISDAGVTNTFRKMLPREIAQKSPIYSIIDKVGPSYSYITVFVGLRGTSEELGLHAGNTHTFSGVNFDKVVQEFLSMTPEEAAKTDQPVMFISFPSAKDPKAWAQKYPDVSDKNSERAELPRNRFIDCDFDGVGLKFCRLWGVPLQNGKPGDLDPNVLFLSVNLIGEMEYIDIGTPVSNKHYLGNPEGELFGLKNIKYRFQPECCMYLRPETGIPGLYITGQDMVHDGLGPCLVGGFITAGAILNRNLLQDAERLEKELKSTSRKKKQ